MKVPVSTTTTTNPKPLSSRNTVSTTTTFLHSSPPTPTTTTTTNLSYEPTSVLDLQRSPSPAAPLPPPPNSTVSDALSVTPNNPAVDLENLDSWDSFLSELVLNDDSNPNPKFISHFNPETSHLPEFPNSQPFDQNPPLITADFTDQFPYNSTNNNYPPYDQSINGLDFIDDLIRASQAFESNDSQQAQVILARLNQRLRSPAGKPLHRAAFYFKEALNYLLTGSPNRPVRLSSYDVVQTIRAFKTFSGVSPIPLFSTFTANQAILEAIDGSNFIHMIDFDIGFGGHWASLMREIVDKATTGADPMKSGSAIVIRITAIVPEEFGVESKLVRENLAQFARELNISFHLEFVLHKTFEIQSFKAVKFFHGEKIAVNLSPATFHRLGSRGNVARFLGDLRSVAAHIVVLVDWEVGMDTGIASFSLNFVAGLEFYTAMLESLDAAVAGGGGGGGDWGRRIEMYLLRPRILAAVEAAVGRRGTTAPSWREVFLGAGIKAVGFSQFADCQADYLLRRVRVGGFHVAKRQGEMLLCWHERPLVATSAWRC